MKGFIVRSIWFLLCLVLFSYNAWRCVDQYLLFETVTKSSQGRQELHKFPLICLGPFGLSEERAAKLNMTPKAFRQGGVWRTEQMAEEEVFANLSMGFSDLVENMRIDQTKMKNSDAYLKVNADSCNLNTKGI